MNDQLERIEKMLRAQLMGAGHVWWVSGYVYGTTSNGDLFIILYPAAENLKEKVVRVYDQDFKKLPRFIPTEGIDGGDTEANPSKEQARKKNIYHECPAFEIVTYDGKDTQMGKERRFGDVLRLSRKAAEALGNSAGAPQQPATRTPPQRPAEPPPPDEIDWGTPSSSHAPGTASLPDYRAMALKATTAAAFDYAAYMVLRNGMYTDQERIQRAREVIVPGWKPAERSNAAMLAALETYRDKRHAAEARGEAEGNAHAFAKREAMSVYNKAIYQ
jgi:hypothetical protein